MEANIKDRKALVTGGGTGIGKGIALELAKEGVDIVIASRNNYPETISQIKSYGVKALWLKTDVSKEKEVINMVKETIDYLGGLDFYINNAAAHWDESVTQLTTSGWINTLNTNLSSCIWGCREVSNYFISKKKEGNILIIGSTVIYGSGQKQVSYRVSKGGLKCFMETLGVELAPNGIRVNMITPGLFETRLTTQLGLMSNKDLIVKSIPLNRVGDIYKDIGPAAVFLLSNKLSSYITCSNIVIDGGIRFTGGETYHTEEKNLDVNN
ncbi:MAG: SDR family NAD(P)-dependent oxidoreductase [Candidatus Humimicrobiaceae bacterium]